MKRLSFLLLAITLTFVFACQPSENQNKNANANANAKISVNANENVAPLTTAPDKVVQIYVYDDPDHSGYYLIDDPGSVILHKKKNQKISWCVIYEGSKSPDEVVLDHFRFPPSGTPTATNPFGDGSPADNKFTITAADFGSCKKGTKTPKETANIGTYKYLITVNVGGVDMGHLDPQVVIDN